MATFSVTVPDDQVQLISEAFAQQFQMETPLDSNQVALTGTDLTNAQIEFARQKCIDFINSIVRMHLVWQTQQQQPEIPIQPLTLT